MENKTINQNGFLTENPLLLLTAQDVAGFLQISEAMAYLLMQRNLIPTVRIGREVRVRPTDLKTFIQQKISSR